MGQASKNLDILEYSSLNLKTRATKIVTTCQKDHLHYLGKRMGASHCLEYSS